MELPNPTQPVSSFELHALRRNEPTLDVVWARHLDEVRAAQRLRYQVFVDEMGDRLIPRRALGASFTDEKAKADFLDVIQGEHQRIFNAISDRKADEA